ncbi:unnamed protein product [Kuraishia capsulata CBS 1993]|uniref:RING-type domain-containing protein n=1 Tax=Kuraishia capsulata CBS 1993 TaxID=1382522 RepID=W6MWG0_9ASCO|nr:uncharacterized protein KUCA_T00003358001 [Kuraishia capsulata CBS 1993]CDK27380.1 unnamed protein product [Kuraishia capsulata CBS 1993]
MSNYNDEHGIGNSQTATPARGGVGHASQFLNLVSPEHLSRTPAGDSESQLDLGLENGGEISHQIAQQLLSAVSEGGLEFRTDLDDNEMFKSPQKGMDQAYFDSLERINKKKIRPGQTCPICASEFLEDPYPLLVRLPCHKNHVFDLECATSWLKEHNTCPICRTELDKPKKAVAQPDSEEDEDMAFFG